MKILHADDSRIERAAMESYLNKSHELITAEDGQQAVELYFKHSPDLVLLDVVMPTMDGYEAARRIRAHNDEWVPIIFLSAKVDAEAIVAGIEAGGDDYLTKPVNQAVLAAKVKAMQRIAEMRRRLLEVSKELEEANAELKRLVNMDGLTRVANRRYLSVYLKEQAALCMEKRRPLSIIMADVDYFKPYNDYYGHLAGDECLQKIADTLRRRLLHQSDLIARYGGEEFCIVLPDTPLLEAMETSENLRTSIETLSLPHEKNDTDKRVTLSLGVASEIPADGFKIIKLLECADSALYEAKRKGRNRTQVYHANKHGSGVKGEKHHAA